MPAPIENAKRIEIVQRHEQGESLRSISDEMGMSYETVKHLWQHWRREGRIEPNYEQSRRRGTRRYGNVYTAAVEMKRAHRRWGAPLIRLKLADEGLSPVPSVRTLQRWFREAQVSRKATQRQAREPRVQRGQKVHQVWAVDAKEQMQLEDGSWASWLVVSDEASGAVLNTEVFSPADMDASGIHGGAGGATGEL